MKNVIHSNSAPEPIGPYSQAIWVNNMLFVSGQIALDPDNGQMISTGVADEAARVLENIKAVLTAAGMDLSHVVKSTLYLKDMNDFKTVNEVYGQYFRSLPPARETVEVSRLPRDAKVEMSCIAVK